jgi:hypothetical protein
MREIAAQIGSIDAAIGEWAARLPDGAPAPAPVLALMDEKERLEAELRDLSARSALPGSSYVASPVGASVEGPPVTAWRRVLGWFRVGS